MSPQASSALSDVRASDSGAIGNGCVGDASSPGTSLFGTARSYAYFRATRDSTWLFMTALLTWAILASFFDSHLLSMSLRNFFCMLALAKLALFDPRYVKVREPAYA